MKHTKPHHPDADILAEHTDHKPDKTSVLEDDDKGRSKGGKRQRRCHSWGWTWGGGCVYYRRRKERERERNPNGELRGAHVRKKEQRVQHFSGVSLPGVLTEQQGDHCGLSREREG